MKLRAQWERLRRNRPGLTALRLVLLLGGCVVASGDPGAASAQERVVLVGSGSSVPAPLYAQWATEYNKRNPGIQMRYLPIGASEGIKQISHGSGDFAAGEVPLSAAERSDANLVELPSVLIGVVPIYNLPGYHSTLRVSGEVLAEIFLGEIKNWNSPAIASLNKDATLPSLPIKVVNRPAGKGTNYVFTEFLSKTSAKFKGRVGVSASPQWPVGEPAERSSDMADKVKAQAGAIGFVELKYAVQGEIAYASVLNAAGKYVKPSAETIAAACRAVEAPGWERFGASLTNAPGEDSYPITSFTWLYVKSGLAEGGRRAAVYDFLTWVYGDGQQMAGSQGYSELPRQLLEKVKTKVSSLD
jgi:phosphate transport system substrate-binding protein